MKIKNLKLETLKLESFTSELSKEQQKEVTGGAIVRIRNPKDITVIGDVRMPGI